MLAALEDMAALAWTLRRKALEDFLLPACLTPDRAILCRDGSLVSLLRIEGCRAAMGEAELERFAATATERLTALFVDRGHALHAVCERAPETPPEVLEATVAAQHRQAATLGLDLGDVLDEQCRHLARLVADETVILAVWTRPSALAAEQARRDRRTARRRLRDWLSSSAPSASASASASAQWASQCPLLAYDSLPPRHEAAVEAVSETLTLSGVAHETLDAGAALAAMRRMLAGAASAPDWRPVGIDGGAPPRFTDPPGDGAWPPPLAPQLLVAAPQRRDDAVALGDRLFGALDVTLGPRSVRPFAALMDAVAAAGLPLRLSILIEGGGIAGVGVAAARIAAAFTAFASADSALKRQALNALTERRADGAAMVRLRIGLLTWVARDGDAAELARRRARLQRIAEGWGEMVTTPAVGDPLEAVAATVPGFACGGTAPPAVAPLAAICAMLPVSRPASTATRRVNRVFRADAGKAVGVSFEGADDYRCDLVYGRPGAGKSVLMNGLGLSFALRGGVDRLPLLAVVDVGPSAAGLISLLRAALPPERRHEAVFATLRMAPESAINPFDTPLGCREPGSAERAFLNNFVGLILTAPGEDGPRDGMREAIAPTIAEAYRLRSDLVAGADPARYARGRDAATDAALDILGCLLPQDALWWDAVDALFAAGDAVAAQRAQRHAVPTMSDLITAVRGDAVRQLVGEAVWGAGGERVIDAAVRILTARAASWPAVFRPTAVDLGGARVAAIDVGPAAAARGGAEADRQAAAMYMLARHVLTAGWWHGLEDVPAPDIYRAWHRQRTRALHETPKRLCYDEFHRTFGAGAVRAQVERDIREGRKLRVGLCLASQRLADFDPALVELATHFWVLGAGGKQSEIDDLRQVLGLTDTAAHAVRHRLTGPGRNGAPALLSAAGDAGRIEHVIWNAPGPSELWALTTAPRDAALRRRLYGLVGPAPARALLARAFPAGTAHGRVAALLGELEDSGADGATEEAVLDSLARDLAAHADAAVAADVAATDDDAGTAPTGDPDPAGDAGAGPAGDPAGDTEPEPSTASAA